MRICAPLLCRLCSRLGALPKKLDKGRAQKAYTARLRAGVTADDLLSATKFYANAVDGTDPKFIKNGATFYGPDEPFRDFVSGIPDAMKSGQRGSSNMQTIDGVLDYTYYVDPYVPQPGHWDQPIETRAELVVGK